MRGRAWIKFTGWSVGALAGALLVLSAPARAQSGPCRLCLWGPDNMAFDAGGNVYIGDADDHGHARVVKISGAGTVLGDFRVFAPGDGADGLAFLPNGILLVTDRGAKSILRIDQAGHKLGVLGPAGGFPALGHLVVEPDGTVFVAQAALNRIERYSPQGKLDGDWSEPGDPQGMVPLGTGLAIDTWKLAHITLRTGEGKLQGEIKEDHIHSTAGLASDGAGYLYQADWRSHAVAVYKDGAYVRTIANTPENHLFDEGPYSLAMDRNGNLWAADGHSVVEFTPQGKLLAHYR